MAAVRAGGNRINALINSLDDYAVHGQGDNRQITDDVGRCLIDAIVAFAERDYRRTIELLLPVRYKIIRIGGSHAQRDVFAQTLMAASCRAGEHNLYRNLVAERFAWRPTKKMRDISMAI